MKIRPLLICLLLTSFRAEAQDVTKLAVPWPPPLKVGDSPFAGLSASSYSSYKKDGAEVNPIWGSIVPADFGPRDITMNTAGIKAVSQVPAPGLHPRILCSRDDLADIRRRLKETRCGQEAWKNLLCYTNMMKGVYDPKAGYAQSPTPINNSGQPSRVPLSRLGVTKNDVAAARYQALINGDTTQVVGGFWQVFPLEAFRCWIDGDNAAALNLGKAVSTALKIEQARRAVARQGKTGPLEQPIAGIHLAYTYDFLYSWLSPEQRKAIHDEIANGTWNHDNYGTFNDASNSRSNWATFSYWLMEVLAIEGEPGFNDLKVRGMYRGWRNLFTYGWFESGATYEGEAKNQLGMDGIMAFALRSRAYGFDNLCAHPYLRAYATNFLPKSVIPTGDGFVKYDLLGGCRTKPFPEDLIGLKFMLPNDKIVDWVYRAAIGENYENVPNRCESGQYDAIVGGGYHNPLLYFLIFASDFDPANNDPSKLGLSDTFFCGERALMMTRSSWDKNALMINLHVRQANGGHPFADRNSIMVAGAGRVWAPIYGWGENGWENVHNSEVVIDDHPQADHIPGRLVDFVDRPQATFAVGDAKYAWDWNWKFKDPSAAIGMYTLANIKNNTIPVDPGWEFEAHSVNDFSYLKRSFSYLTDPLSVEPDWIKPKGAIRPILRGVNYPVQRAFRTAGLVRGTHPYALVVDDIQKDAQAHDYTWYLTLEHDIQIAKLTHPTDHEMEVVLTGSDPTQVGPPAKDALPATLGAAATVPAGQPMLLVRFLNYKTDATAPSKAEAKEPTILEDAPPATLKTHQAERVRRLAVPVHATSPDFKVLIYAYHQGDALPATTWKGDHSLGVTWSDQTDRIDFASAASGKTNVTVTRGSEVLATVNKEIAPLDPPK